MDAVRPGRFSSLNRKIWVSTNLQFAPLRGLSRLRIRFTVGHEVATRCRIKELFYGRVGTEIASGMMVMATEWRLP